MRLSLPRYCQPLAVVLPVFFFLVLLSGCGDGYSERAIYPVRTDPILKEKLGNAIFPGYEPDGPGQLPLVSLDDVKDSRNPYYKDREEALSFDKVFRDSTKIRARDRAALQGYLKDLFGTPAQPMVFLSDQDLATLKLDAPTLEKGSKLYRVHCLQCHGLTGDGRGPTAKWVNPHPRDYRKGLFKFQSVDQASKPGKPRREDLFRVIKYGVEGTSMPAFNLLPDDDLEALVSYVMHLSMRGEVEELAILQMKYEGEEFFFEDPPDTDEFTGMGNFLYGGGNVRQGALDRVRKDWLESQNPSRVIPVKVSDKVVLDESKDPQGFAESVQRGWKLFQQGNPSCVSCHKDYGRQAEFKYDEWGTLVKARDLTTGIYRGGRRPIDLYWRIHSGISGSGMPPFGATLSPEQIWDVVNFVRVLPYPAMRERYGIKLN